MKNKKKSKKLVTMISAKGKDPKQVAEEAMKNVDKFSEAAKAAANTKITSKNEDAFNKFIDEIDKGQKKQ